MAHQVWLTADAEQDLRDIYDYIATTDSMAHANLVLDRLATLLQGMAQFPERGAHPKELLELGIRDYRQTVAAPYRVIYRIVGRRVLVYLIADRRRDMQTLLARRMLGAA